MKRCNKYLQALGCAALQSRAEVGDRKAGQFPAERIGQCAVGDEGSETAEPGGHPDATEPRLRPPDLGVGVRVPIGGATRVSAAWVIGTMCSPASIPNRPTSAARGGAGE